MANATPTFKDQLRIASACLRARRAELGLSQAHVARLAGLSREQVNRIEGGRAWPRFHTQVALSVALDLDRQELFPEEATVGG